MVKHPAKLVFSSNFNKHFSLCDCIVCLIVERWQQSSTWALDVPNIFVGNHDFVLFIVFNTNKYVLVKDKLKKML